jgi:hypothetical protein
MSWTSPTEHPSTQPELNLAHQRPRAADPEGPRKHPYQPRPARISGISPALRESQAVRGGEYNHGSRRSK